jgi:hypothetical protein
LNEFLARTEMAHEKSPGKGTPPFRGFFIGD